MSEHRIIPIRALTADESEVARQIQICNACRYCEGFCAVFPAMTRRLEFGKADVNYLANLCHNCGACLHACQYAPPHEFGVNIPQAMARVRLQTYTEYAWPSFMGRAYQHNGVFMVLILALFLGWLMPSAASTSQVLDGNFYSVFPHNFLAVVFGSVFIFAVLALGVAVMRFWRDVSEIDHTTSSEVVSEVASNVLQLTYLDGGHGQGCNEADDAFTLLRRRFHHLTFYGFALCFMSTAVATLMHYVANWHAPYAYDSAPVVLGTLGGMGLLVGPAGLLWLNWRRHPTHGDVRQRPMDRAFIVLLCLVSVTGLALLVGRQTMWMPQLLCLHLGVVMVFFITMPFGKFAHGFYRTAALLKFAIEKRKPLSLGLAQD
jgi:citrate/tricarballylate utilization protein